MYCSALLCPIRLPLHPHPNSILAEQDLTARIVGSQWRNVKVLLVLFIVNN